MTFSRTDATRDSQLYEPESKKKSPSATVASADDDDDGAKWADIITSTDELGISRKW